MPLWVEAGTRGMALPLVNGIGAFRMRLASMAAIDTKAEGKRSFAVMGKSAW